MKKKLTKNEKGITLVALIITIIVLLILAVVSIRAITGDNILGKAETAKNKYESAKSNEILTLGEYSKEIDNNNSNAAKYFKFVNGEGTTLIIQLKNNRVKVYVEKSDGLFYNTNIENQYDLLQLEIKVKVNGEVYNYDYVLTNKISDPNDYDDTYDIIVNGTHYARRVEFLLSDTGCIVDPSPIYDKNTENDKMTDCDYDGIAELLKSFDESLLREEQA